MKKLLLILLIGLSLISCSGDRTIQLLNPSEADTLKIFKNLEEQNQLQISDKNEVGQKLWLGLTFISKESKMPIINEPVRLYHTASSGNYEPVDPTDETTARLSGTVQTNENGQIFVRTILPGNYSDSGDNRHIHTTVSNAKPETYDIHFKQYTGFMGKNFISGSDQHFLADLKQTRDSVLVSFLTIEVKNNQSLDNLANKSIPDCQWCGANEAPKNISWESSIADESVEGERLILEGIIYESDGNTPAENVIVYAYHTNKDGLYEKKGNETGNGIRHGYLRGWAKTNREGKYRFYTIKPAPYPNNAEPAHIHITLQRADFNEYWINATWFKGDTIITEEMIKKLNRQGGFSNIIELEQDEVGTWVGTRDIIITQYE